jgi:hypothetical protein
LTEFLPLPAFEGLAHKPRLNRIVPEGEEVSNRHACCVLSGVHFNTDETGVLKGFLQMAGIGEPILPWNCGLRGSVKSFLVIERFSYFLPEFPEFVLRKSPSCHSQLSTRPEHADDIEQRRPVRRQMTKYEIRKNPIESRVRIGQAGYGAHGEA